MDGVFDLVYQILKWFSDLSGFTYREINIIVYFIIVPFFFLHLIDRIVGKNYFKIGFSLVSIVSLLIIQDFESFSETMFDASVRFLKWFEIIGWNYTETSVIICVLFPLVLTVGLIYFGRAKRIE